MTPDRPHSLYPFCPLPTSCDMVDTAVILAAGAARRLRPLTDACPKCLLEVGGRSMLGHIVDALRGCGVTRLVVVTGYRGDMVADYLHAEFPDMEAVLVHNRAYETTNNIHSLWLAGRHVRGREFLLLDSDIMVSTPLVARLLEASGPALAVNSHPCGQEEMKVVVSPQDGAIIAITKDCDPATALGESVGVEKVTCAYSQALFQTLDTMVEDEGLSGTYYEDAFMRLIHHGHRLAPVDVTDLAPMEIDTPEDLEEARRMWARKK